MKTALFQAGFRVIDGEDCFKAVRGFCQICISRKGDGLVLSIPVVKLEPGDPPENLVGYLRDRNSHHKGPGKFRISRGTVFYECIAQNDDAVTLCLEAQRTVEKLGPKILNVLGYPQ